MPMTELHVNWRLVQAMQKTTNGAELTMTAALVPDFRKCIVFAPLLEEDRCERRRAQVVPFSIPVIQFGPPLQ